MSFKTSVIIWLGCFVYIDCTIFYINRRSKYNKMFFIDACTTALTATPKHQTTRPFLLVFLYSEAVGQRALDNDGLQKKKPISEIRLANWKDAYLDNGRGTVSERKINVIQIPKRCAFYKYLFCRLENSIIRYIISSL